jgi:hypothetical protein
MEGNESRVKTIGKSSEEIHMWGGTRNSRLLMKVQNRFLCGVRDEEVE